MNNYTLHILGIEIAFKAEAGTRDLDKAKTLIETRAEQLKLQGRIISKEKTLLFIALGLAYDLIQANDQLSSIQDRLESILSKVEVDTQKEILPDTHVME